VIVTMDADLQDDPEEIPQLVEMLEKNAILFQGGKKGGRIRFSIRCRRRLQILLQAG